MRSLPAALALLLAACGDDSADIVVDRPTAASWAIGAPDAAPSGPSFDIPQHGSVNYVTRPTGSLEGKSRITLRYRVEMAEGTRLFPPSMPDGPSIITLYIQRRGDDWSGRGRFETYRWYATRYSQIPIEAGDHVLTAPLADGEPNADPKQIGLSNWTAVGASSSYLNGDYAAALKDAGRVGFVLGGGTGYGHGVSATGPARFAILDFRID